MAQDDAADLIVLRDNLQDLVPIVERLAEISPNATLPELVELLQGAVASDLQAVVLLRQLKAGQTETKP